MSQDSFAIFEKAKIMCASVRKGYRKNLRSSLANNCLCFLDATLFFAAVVHFCFFWRSSCRTFLPGKWNLPECTSAPSTLLIDRQIVASLIVYNPAM